MSIFMQPNKYGYRVNILDPRIRPLYDRFKAKKGIPQHFPCSDAERMEFEDAIITWFLKNQPEQIKIVIENLNKNGE